MKIVNHLNLIPIKLFGYFMVLLTTGKIVAKYNDLYSEFTGADIIIISITLIIAYILITFTSSTECRENLLLVRNGIAGWKRETIYQQFDKITFSIGFHEVKNGADRAYLSVSLVTSQKAMIRSKNYTIDMLSAPKKGVILFKQAVESKLQKDITHFEQTADQLMLLYPDITVEVDERAQALYQAITDKPFKWYRDS